MDSATTAGPQPLKIAVMAMGGEGGGVLADWLVALGEANGFVAQTTSVPGVAQRTGATIYYVELFPAAEAGRAGLAPVLALMPLPGDVDVVLASELMEAGRAVQRGLVTPDRTTLVASTHRIYAIAEKTALGDGRVDSAALLAHARGAARRLVAFDMAELAERAGSVVSAVLFGALAGAGVVPFTRAAFEATIERGGVGVAASLKAFAEGYAAAQGAAPVAATAGPVDASVPAPSTAALDGTTDAPAGGDATGRAAPDGGAAPDRAAAPASVPHPSIQALLDRIGSDFPDSSHAMLREGVRRLVDYQDAAYAGAYLERLRPLARVDGAAGGLLLREAARHLALWMAYEDTMRVAQLKTRTERFERVRGETRAGAGQVLAIDEYLHPRVEEIAESLPGWLGRAIERQGVLQRIVRRATSKGRVVTTTSLGGFLLLRGVAAMRRFRRSTSRFALESRRIDDWLARAVAAAGADPALATEIVRCQRLVKGYGETHARGWRSFVAVMDALDAGGPATPPSRIRALRDAALADEHGTALGKALAEPLAA